MTIAATRLSRRLPTTCLFLIGMAVTTIPVTAQQTFTVTVEAKTSEHPYHGQGWPEGYVIDGQQGAELTLVRGETYVFQMSSVPPDHPFYISTSDAGAGAGIWNDGVDENFVTGNGTLTFEVPDHAPDLLWYQCSAHDRMGWRINITDPVDAEPAASTTELLVSGPHPNPTAAQSAFVITLPHPAEVRLAVLDLLGRTVKERSFGQMEAGLEHTLSIDVSGLPAGNYVYFIEALSADRVSRASGSMLLAP